MSLARFRVVCIAVVLRLSVAVPAIGLMGPPAATHKALQVSLGLEYSYSEENVKLTDQGSIPLDGLSDVERNTSSGNLGVGLKLESEDQVCIALCCTRVTQFVRLRWRFLRENSLIPPEYC